MPTGYTESVGKGEMTTLKEYASLCARNFSPVYRVMHDKPLSTPIPREFPVNIYYLKKLNEIQDKYNKFLKMTEEEKIEFYKTSIKNKRKYYRESYYALLVRNQHYNEMLVKVNNWNPPSQDFVELKNFMLNQLEISIEDSSYFEKKLLEADPSYEEFIYNYERDLIDDIQRYTEYFDQDKEYAKGATQWITTLLDSIDE